MVTLKDIADLTGVSISTVSRVLNGKGKIGDETKKKVLSAAEELMFKRGVVSSQVDGRVLNFGVVVPQTEEYYHDDPASSADIRSIRSCFEQRGHRTALYFYSNYPGAEEDMVERLQRDEMSAVILSDPLTDRDLVDYLYSAQVPFVIVNGIYADDHFHQMDFDNRAGMRRLAELVLLKGHTEIAVLAGPRTHLVTQNRLDGLRDAILEGGLTMPEKHLLYGAFSLESGYQRARQFVASGLEFTAIVAFSDYIALGAMRALKEAGLAIPKDVAVVGFDDIEIAQYSDPPLTTVHRYSETFAPAVLSTLTDLVLPNRDLKSIRALFEAPVVVRDSL